MPDNLLQLQDVYKSYARGGKLISVLNGVSLTLNPGDTLSIIGPSGAGKSTLLHILGTLDNPDAGAFTYRGQDMLVRDDAALAQFRNEKLGFVFQFHHLLPEFTALENVMMPGLIAQRPEAEIRAAAEAVLADVGISHRLSHRPSQLSGGEQQRVALARALVMRPEILLADEVTGNLDEQTAEQIHSLLFDLNEKYKTALVIVTHNRALADSMARRFRLVAGKLEEQS